MATLELEKGARVSTEHLRGSVNLIAQTNAGNETMNFSIDGTPYQVIAMDGHDIHEPGWLKGEIVPLGAGQRYDLQIQIPESGMVIVSSPSAKSLPIRIGSGSEPEHSEGGEQFSFVNYGTPLTDDPGLKIKPNRNFELKLGQTLFVKSINGHAFHEIPLQGSPVYLDTLLTQQGETYELYLEADNPGLWMAHCHNLQHASMGMSMMFNYEGVTTPYRVGTKSGNLPDL